MLSIATLQTKWAALLYHVWTALMHRVFANIVGMLGKYVTTSLENTLYFQLIWKLKSGHIYIELSYLGTNVFKHYIFCPESGITMLKHLMLILTCRIW